MCLLCDQPDAPELDGFCPACLVPFRIEVVSGLRQLGEYLAAWAAFEEWCDGRRFERSSSRFARGL